MQTYTLLKPITFEGEEITALEYDFDDLTGRDLISAERATGLAATGDVKLTPILSQEFQAHIFAKASKKPIDLILSLKGPDFAEACALTLVFLTNQA